MSWDGIITWTQVDVTFEAFILKWKNKIDKLYLAHKEKFDIENIENLRSEIGKLIKKKMNEKIELIR